MPSGYLVVNGDTAHHIYKMISIGEYFNAQIFIATDKGLFMNTDNMADSFKNVTFTTGTLKGKEIKAVAADARNIYVATDSNVYISRNHGTSWGLTAYQPDEGITDLTIADKDFILSYSNNGIYYSADSMKTYQMSNVMSKPVYTLYVPYTPYGPNYGSRYDVYAGSDKFIYGSNDGGKTWSILGTGISDSVSIGSIAYTNKLYAADKNGYGLFSSDDQGRTWEKEDSAIFQPGCPVTGVSVGFSDSVLASTGGTCGLDTPLRAENSTIKVWKAQDNGLTQGIYPFVVT